jgi:hypothetical protein
LKDRKLIATDAVNSPKEFVQSKALISSHTELDRNQLADTDIQLRDFLQ